MAALNTHTVVEGLRRVESFGIAEQHGSIVFSVSAIF